MSFIDSHPRDFGDEMTVVEEFGHAGKVTMSQTKLLWLHNEMRDLSCLDFLVMINERRDLGCANDKQTCHKVPNQVYLH